MDKGKEKEEAYTRALGGLGGAGLGAMGAGSKAGAKSDNTRAGSKVGMSPAEAEIQKARGKRQMKKGGMVSSVSKRADGCAVRGKTKCKMV